MLDEEEARLAEDKANNFKNQEFTWTSECYSYISPYLIPLFSTLPSIIVSHVMSESKTKVGLT